MGFGFSSYEVAKSRYRRYLSRNLCDCLIEHFN